MTQNESVNEKLSISLLHKLKSETKVATNITLTLSSNMIVNSESSFLQNFL